MYLSNSQQTHKQRKEEKNKTNNNNNNNKTREVGGGREVKNKTGRREAVTEFDRLHMRTRTEL